MRRIILKTFWFALLISALFCGFFAISVHATSADQDHDQERCRVCAWFKLQGWLATGYFLLTYIINQINFIRFETTFSSRFFLSPPGRSPPLLVIPS